jgi:hypothetical protein
MFSDIPGTPGMSMQIPRMFSLILTPALDARYRASITSTSAREFILAMIEPGVSRLDHFGDDRAWILLAGPFCLPVDKGYDPVFQFCRGYDKLAHILYRRIAGNYIEENVRLVRYLIVGGDDSQVAV